MKILIKRLWFLLAVPVTHTIILVWIILAESNEAIERKPWDVFEHIEDIY